MKSCYLPFFFLLIFSFVLQAQTRITPDDAKAEDQIAFTMDAYGNRIVVAASQLDDNATNSGGAYVFVYENGLWTQEAKLVPEGSTEEDNYGSWVSIHGIHIILSQHNDDTNGLQNGSVLMYEMTDDGWKERAYYLGPGLDNGSFFGWQCDNYNDLAAVGAISDQDHTLVSTGSVTIYEFNDAEGWFIQSKVYSDELEGGDTYGASMVLGEDFLAVGSRRDDDGANDAGAVYIFEKQDFEWVQTDKLIASDAGAADIFGYRLAGGSDQLIVTSFAKNIDLGGVYIFEKENDVWVETAILENENATGGERFGASVSIDGNRAIVGARGHNNQGAVYIYEKIDDAWVQTIEILAPENQEGQFFGVSHAVVDSQLVVGAWMKDTELANTGALYAYDLGTLSSIASVEAISVNTYPNPVNAVLNVDSEISWDNYTIYSSNGQLAENNKLQGNKVDVSQLNQGYYILKLTTKDKSKIISFIKQ